MVKKSYAFIILQYGAYEYTKKCIDSIYRYIQEPYRIIVVDNASRDDSYERLEKDFMSDEKVVILQAKKNLGFAKGNNLGFRYAKENFHPDYIILLNNDTELLNTQFCKVIEEEYNRSAFHVMGPLILTEDGRYTSNPVRTSPWREEEVKMLIKHDRLRLRLDKYNLLSVYRLAYIVKQMMKRKKPKTKIDSLSRQENVELHGSFLIFSRDYIREFDGLNEDTFMYCEEHILYQTLMKRGLKTVYNPQLMVYHAEDASTDKAFSESREKDRFLWENHRNSCKVLLDIIINEVS